MADTTGTWTKNKRTGSYDVLARDCSWEPGDQITVVKKDGTSRAVTIDRVSRPFTARFGTLQGQRAVIITPRHERHGGGHGHNHGSGYGRGECPACGEEREPGAKSCWECGYRW